jgi:hypothetical protein
MEISKETIEKFKKIYKEEYQEEISDAEALEIAQRVVGFLLLIYRPQPEGDGALENPDIEF